MTPDPSLEPSPSSQPLESAPRSEPAQQPSAAPASAEPGPETQPITCATCGTVNAAGVRYCTQCHATLLYRCPLCFHLQRHGGTCDACGTNFDAFWSSYLALKNQEDAQVALDKLKSEASLLVQIVMLPITGGRWVGSFLVNAIARIFGRSGSD